MFKALPVVLTLFLVSFSVSAQFEMESSQPDYYSFSERAEAKLSTEARELVPVTYQTHPEYAKNPYNAPCEDCTELIDRRMADQRYFVKNGTGGQTFYSQKSYGQLHMMDQQGNWITIDPRLAPSATPGKFSAKNQYFPVELDVVNPRTAITILGKEFAFNTELELLHKDNAGTSTSLGQINWSNYTAGDDGVKVMDAWPGIDMEIRVFQGRIKTNFIVKERPALGNGFLVIKDKIVVPDDLHTDMNLTTQMEEDRFEGRISFRDESEQEYFFIDKAFAFDASDNIRPYYLNYSFSDDHQLGIYIPLEWLESSSTVYPVTIDPLFSSSTSIPQSTILGTRYGGSACFAFMSGCQYSVITPVPANCTITNIAFSFNYNALGTCFLNQGAMQLSTGACFSPGPNGIWTCNQPGNAPGVCNGNNISVFNHFSSCIPNPQCAPYNMTFGLTFYSCNPLNGTPCGNNNICITAGSDWIMTIEGKTVEIPTITGSQTICVGNSATLIASGNFGVPPYSYSWSPGGMTGTTVTVSPGSTTVYTATITDACAQTATASSTVTVTQNTNPGFTISPNPVCAGQPVSLTGAGAGPSSSYDWTFPGSTTPAVNNNKTPTVTYNTPNTYNITLNYAQGTCIFPLVQQVTVTAAGTAPSVSVTSNPPGAICQGTNVNFTATPTNGGSGPSYQWQVNGVNAAGTGASFSSNTLNNGDVVTVILTSNANCVSPATATSTALVMVVNPTVVPSVTIVQSPTGSVCAGANVTFTATPVNGGASPTYQWTVNGTNVGTGASYSSTTLNNGDVVAVTLTSNAACVSPTTATSNTINVSVNPSVAPSVTIAASPSGSICPGTNVTFTATPTNGGAAPTYQWTVNGTNAGTGASFSSATLNNADAVQVVMTSNAACAVPPTATSNTITMTVSPAQVPSVTITANPPGPICTGTNITFTATPVNGGGAPAYQWQVNGSNAGTGGTFSSSSLNNNDAVTVIMTSNAVCASPLTATSNTITIIVTSTIVPAVTIAASPSGPVCAGTSITFTPTPTNGGSNPAYQWQVNGTNAGNLGTFTSTTLNNGDLVSVVMTSNAGCASPLTATSNTITMQVFPVVAPSVTIAANPSGPICSGTSVTFTATPTNGGLGPAYQWQVNGTNAGTGATFTSAMLSNGDNVTVILTSNAPCVSPVAATSNAIAMAVTTTVVPSVTVAANPAGQVCTGTSVTFTATPVNGGSNPVLQWQVNGTNAGTGPAFTSSSLNNNDVVTVVLTSDAPCASPLTATSTAITMSVSSVVTPSVTVVAAPSNATCSGVSVTFTASPSGGGTTPTYQWTVNGTNAGTGATYSSSSLADGDIIEVVMTSSSGCANPQTATSNAVTMTISQPVAPSVTIADSPAGTQCAGTAIIFTPTPVSGGSNPAYQWQLNGVNAGTGSSYSSSSLNDGDVVSVVLTSDAACATPVTAASNSITVSIDQAITPSVTVSATPAGTVCPGVQVDFTAVPSSAGANPTFQWTVNGTNAGTGATFSSTTLNDGDIIVVNLTSTAACANPSNASSLPLTVDVGTFVTPAVSIVASPSGPVCNGAAVTFTATGTNGGATPVYQWLVNGSNTGSGTTFTSSTLSDGDIVTVVLTSSEPCTNGNPATSNAITITLAAPLSVVASDDITVCSGEASTLTALASGGDGIYTYTWNNGAGNGSSVNVNPAQTTTYTVSVSDQCGSTPVTDDVIVNVDVLIAYFTFTPEEATIFDPEIMFENHSQGEDTYLWDFGDGQTSTDENPVHVYDGAGDYEVTLTVTSAGGCEATTHYPVSIVDITAFWIPNSFTPNGDGLNDFFGMQGTYNMPYTMRIFNRLGSEIYFTAESEPWNGGMFNVGDIVQNGVYIYYIDLEDSDYKGKPLSGRVTLLRDGK